MSKWDFWSQYRFKIVDRLLIVPIWMILHTDRTLGTWRFMWSRIFLHRRSNKSYLNMKKKFVKLIMLTWRLLSVRISLSNKMSPWHIQSISRSPRRYLVSPMHSGFLLHWDFKSSCFWSMHSRVLLCDQWIIWIICSNTKHCSSRYLYFSWCLADNKLFSWNL